MRILALDPGAVNIGWAVFDENDAGVDLKLIEYGVLTINSAESSFHDKMNEEMCTALEYFAEVHSRLKPERCAWELPPSFGQYGNRDRVVSVLSVFKTLAWEHECEYAGLSPRAVKEIFTGDSKASKGLVKEKAREMFSSLPDDLAPDVYDSIAVGVSSIKRDEWKVRGWWTRQKK